MRGPVNARPEHEAARLAIARLALEDDRGLSLALSRALEISGRTLGVAHVGVWVVSPNQDALHLMADFRLDDTTPKRPSVISLKTWPTYEQLFRSQRVVGIDDARHDPAAAELWKDYLEPLNVGALLDAAVFVGGEVWAVVCHEHEGDARSWKPSETAFAAAVADMLSALFEQSRRVRAEKLLREREQELARARRREVLVQISAGIAHDFRNALHVILSSAALAKREADASQREELLATVIEEAERANRVTRQLTDLARGKDVVLATLDAAACVDALASSLDRLARDKGVELRFSLDGDARVKAERTLFERAVTNLVANAVEASSRGGVVEVAVRVAKGSVLVEVADRGAGIRAADRERLFDPFFTTKDSGGGTGLGLAVVALAAELFGGDASANERDGGGACFVVRLPASE